MEINCPLFLNNYNRLTGGVDKNDQIAIMHKEMKQLVWYNCVFFLVMHSVCACPPAISWKKENTQGKRSNNKFDPNRLVNVGEHLPEKGKGKDHHCIVCGETRKRWLDANPNKDPINCLMKDSTTTFCCTCCANLP